MGRCSSQALSQRLAVGMRVFCFILFFLQGAFCLCTQKVIRLLFPSEDSKEAKHLNTVLCWAPSSSNQHHYLIRSVAGLLKFLFHMHLGKGLAKVRWLQAFQKCCPLRKKKQSKTIKGGTREQGRQKNLSPTKRIIFEMLQVGQNYEKGVPKWLFSKDLKPKNWSVAISQSASSLLPPTSQPHPGHSLFPAAATHFCRPDGAMLALQVWCSLFCVYIHLPCPQRNEYHCFSRGPYETSFILRHCPAYLS